MFFLLVWHQFGTDESVARQCAKRAAFRKPSAGHLQARIRNALL
jgi:hypothetical protein